MANCNEKSGGQLGASAETPVEVLSLDRLIRISRGEHNINYEGPEGENLRLTEKSSGLK